MIIPECLREGTHFIRVANNGHPHVLLSQLHYLPVFAVHWLKLIEYLQQPEHYLALNLLVVEQVEYHLRLIDAGGEDSPLIVRDED